MRNLPTGSKATATAASGAFETISLASPTVILNGLSSTVTLALQNNFYVKYNTKT